MSYYEDQKIFSEWYYKALQQNQTKPTKQFKRSDFYNEVSV